MFHLTTFGVESSSKVLVGKKIQIFFFKFEFRFVMCHQTTLSIKSSLEALVEKKEPLKPINLERKKLSIIGKQIENVN
jgi:hypothetical protein